MKTKDKLLSLLEENRGNYFSGEEIAEKLSVTRAAVWKAVKSLREEGYQIDAVQNKGYCLAVQTDILSSQGIRKYLGPVCKDLELEILAEVDSTNAWIRQKAAVGAEEGCTIIANEQTCGKGRWGRSFYSPAGTGIYMSILLRPQGWSPEKAVRLTTMAAVSACEAAEEISGEKAEIKWVNDIYMRGKKVSGILTEASFSLESGCVDYAVLGIGFNVYKPEGGFPEELKHTAGAVFDSRQNDGKNRLAAEFLNRFMQYYTARDMSEYKSRYRERSMVIGKEISVVLPGGSKKGVALDVDEECRLVVRLEDGKLERLSSGEISIRVNLDFAE